MSPRRLCSSFMLLAIALIACAFIPPFRSGALFWWAAGLASMVTALLIAARQSQHDRPDRRTRRPLGGGSVPLSLALVLSLSAFVMSPDAGPVPEIEFTPTIVPTQDLPRSDGVAALGSAALPALHALATTAALLEPVGGATRDAFVAAAEQVSYQPRSGLQADFATATAARGPDGSVVVRVPLIGTAIPDLSAITLVHSAGESVLTEVVATMVDRDHVAVAVWENGTQTVNSVIENRGEEAATPSPVRGVDWTKLNSCLAGAGISWAIIAVIGVVCAAACATVVACGSCIAVAAGFTSGTITGCVTEAWV